MSEQIRVRPRGLAAMSPERRREIAALGGRASCRQRSAQQRKLLARLGGQAVQASGRGHRWTREEALRYAPLGGSVPKRYHRKEVS